MDESFLGETRGGDAGVPPLASGRRSFGAEEGGSSSGASVYLSDLEGQSERTPTASLEADDSDEVVAIETPRASPSATTVARRGSQKLTQYLSWQRSVAVREGLFSELEGATDGRHRVFAPDSVFSLAWALWITLLTLTYVALLEPIFVAFDAPIRVRPPWRWSALVDLVGGLTFLLDVLVTFRTAVVVSSDVLGRRKLVSRPSDIARVYVRSGTFVFDALALVPFVYQVALSAVAAADDALPRGEDEVPALEVAHGLRLLRLLRLARLRKHLFGTTVGNAEAVLFRETAVSPLALFACQTLYEFYFVINFTACILVYVANAEGFERSWVAVVSEDLDPAHADPREVYVAAMYFATATTSTVGYGDISATTHAERIAATLCMTVGATYYAFLVGSVAGIIERYGSAASRRAAFRDKMVQLRSFLHRNPIPRETRARLAAYFSDAWLRGLRRVDDDALLGELPDRLRREVRFRVLEPALRRAFVAPGRDPGERALRAAAERLVKRSSPRGARLVDPAERRPERPGTRSATAFHLVVEGEVLVVSRKRNRVFDGFGVDSKKTTERKTKTKATTTGATTTTTTTRAVRGDDAAPCFGAEAFGIDPAEGFVVDAVAVTACVTWELSPEDAARLADEHPALVERLRRPRDEDEMDSESS